MTHELEPLDIAAERDHTAADGIAILMLGLGASLAALIPPARLVALTALRLAVAAILAGAALVTSGVVAAALSFGAHGFLLLAIISIAAHVEGATLGPIADRLIKGRE